jgi:hypothetical protein
MKMIFSNSKAKPIPQIIKNQIFIEKSVIKYSFMNIFSRLESSGSCKSCG